MKLLTVSLISILIIMMTHKFRASREFSTVKRILQSLLQNEDSDLYRSFEVIMVVGAVFVVFWFVMSYVLEIG